MKNSQKQNTGDKIMIKVSSESLKNEFSFAKKIISKCGLNRKLEVRRADANKQIADFVRSAQADAHNFQKSHSPRYRSDMVKFGIKLKLMKFLNF